MNIIDQIQKKSSAELSSHQKINFYKLHYPSKKNPESSHPTRILLDKQRSKSVVSVLESAHNQQTADLYLPKGSIRKYSMRKQTKAHSLFLKQRSREKQLIKQTVKYKQPVSFMAMLGCRGEKRQLKDVQFPFNSMKEIEELGRRNSGVRHAIQKNKDEKIKISRIILSHKQPEQVKINYLKAKRQQVQEQISHQISAIYSQYFKKQYENAYGESAQPKFHQRLTEIVATLSQRIFQK